MSTLPPPPRKCRNAPPDAPGLATRGNNKTVKPAEAAGLVNTRRSSEQKAADDAREAEEKACAEQEEEKKLARVAAIEDKQRQQDLKYRQHANRPIDSDPPHRPPHKNTSPGPDPRSPSTTPARDDFILTLSSDPRANDDESDTYKTPEQSSDDQDDTDDTDDNKGGDSAVPRRKKPKKGRADIKATRQTQDNTGTPEIESSGQKRKARDNG
ncbi:hypothetical protein B0H14DRAFT_3524645 [Mycena olivaceomarginata]|nr:hypothetical protein B0H14DRAFT_3524645 [Mycena olivaceomarginata]